MNKIRFINMPKYIKFFLCVYILIYFILFIDNSFIDDKTILLSILTLLSEGITIIILLYNIIYNKLIKEWKFLFLGIFFYSIGDFIWLTNYVLWNINLDVPSICDVFFLLGVAMFLTAIQCWLKKININIFKVTFDILIIMVIATTIVYKYFVLSIWNDEILSFTSKMITIIYPLSDLAFLAIILVVVFSNNIQLSRKKTTLFLIISFSIFFTTDIIYTIVKDIDIELTMWVKPIWSIGFILMALASFYSDSNISKNITTINEYHASGKYAQKLHYLKLFFPYILVTVFIIITGWKHMHEDVLVTGAIIATLFILIRQIFSIIENEKLLNTLYESNLELKVQKGKKELEASLDYLTKLYNRRYLSKSIQSYINKHSNDEIIQFCIFLIDVDHYKQFNDVYGHVFGDKVLVEIATTIKENIRADDIAGRYGGDEFIIFLPKTNENKAKLLAKRLINLINDKIFHEDATIKITLSIGNLLWQGKKESFNLTEIIKSVDEILYEAKTSGRNTVISKKIINNYII